MRRLEPHDGVTAQTRDVHSLRSRGPKDSCLQVSRLRALKQEKGDLGLDGDTVRHLLGRSATGLMTVPFGGRISVSQEKMAEIIGA
jgi:hypothetical protein